VPPEYGPEQFAADFDVSRETLDRLQTYVDVLTDWNSRHNLVSESSLAQVWQRHIADSAQLVRYIPENAWTLVDLGSGAGFPGLVLAAMLKGGLQVTLYESISKKCDFLNAAADAMGLRVTVLNERAERASQQKPSDIVTARAVAPLAKLLGYAQHFWGKNTMGLFLKGQNIVPELTEAHISWKMDVRQHPSLTDPSGVIVEIRTLKHVQPEKTPHPRGRQSKGRRR
jgi:16S rRNA (guanine527-N7)-methyltransferase